MSSSWNLKNPASGSSINAIRNKPYTSILEDDQQNLHNKTHTPHAISVAYMRQDSPIKQYTNFMDGTNIDIFKSPLPATLDDEITIMSSAGKRTGGGETSRVTNHGSL